MLPGTLQTLLIRGVIAVAVVAAGRVIPTTAASGRLLCPLLLVCSSGRCLPSGPELLLLRYAIEANMPSIRNQCRCSNPAQR